MFRKWLPADSHARNVTFSAHRTPLAPVSQILDDEDHSGPSPLDPGSQTALCFKLAPQISTAINVNPGSFLLGGDRFRSSGGRLLPHKALFHHRLRRRLAPSPGWSYRASLPVVSRTVPPPEPRHIPSGLTQAATYLSSCRIRSDEEARLNQSSSEDMFSSQEPPTSRLEYIPPRPASVPQCGQLSQHQTYLKYSQLSGERVLSRF
ncbi:hypothetical protein B0H14DRAFT_2979561 [Mycena olivaceomarginata]|nr:hypothetical protein B0H14DRAFT_2979561 [Mycena olivaceomarginata]